MDKEQQQQQGGQQQNERREEDRQQGTGRVEFTPEQQAAIDELVAERVRRAERAAAQRAKEEANEAAKRAQMDETERLKAEKEDAVKQAAEALARADRTLVAAEARVAAAAAGAKPERLDRVLRLLDLDAVTVEDGTPDAKAVASAVAALKDDIPELFGGAPSKRSGADMEGGGDGKRVWTRALLDAVGAHQVRLAVPGWRHADEVAPRLQGLARVDAIDVCDPVEWPAAAGFLGLPIPVATIAGRPATLEVWSECLADAGVDARPAEVAS